MTAIVNAFHRVWPLVGVATAVLITVAWMGLLGYGLSRLGVLPF